MSLVAMIIANEPCSLQSASPACLEQILGDPALLWQLRALPSETERVWIITGDDHEKIEIAIEDLKRKGQIAESVMCHQNQNVLHALLELSETNSIPSNGFILFLNSTQPFVSPEVIQKLTSLKSDALLRANVPLDGSQGPMHVGISWILNDKHGLRQSEESVWHYLSLRYPTACVVACDAKDLLYLRTRQDFSDVQKLARERIVNAWLELGVTFMDTNSVFIGPRVVIAEQGVILEPQIRLEGSVSIGSGTSIGQGSIIRDSAIGENVEIRPYCVIDGAIIGNGARIGPFAHLRKDTQLDSNVHLGNFVETKKAHLREDAKANHLSYLGDCEIGERSNIGAGCITCNYDGFKKHKTVIGNDVFVGSDCQLIAPVTVGEGAILGAGTTLTVDTPTDALVLTRSETTMLEGGAKKLRAKLRATHASGMQGT